MPRLIHEVADLDRELTRLRERGPVGFVPTMGALHAGHLSLLERARSRGAQSVVVSVFVNPTQFGPDEDFDRYPRTLAADCEALESTGCDVVFAPSVEAVYPPGYATFIEPSGPARGFEAAARPGHFRGVATVVARLFALVRPDLAVFGEKDAQQLAVVRRVVADLAWPLEVVAAPIARDPDGLAMSSRNRYLSSAQREAATAIPRGLARARALVAAGERSSSALITAVEDELARESEIDTIDYAAVVDRHTFEIQQQVASNALLVVAARLGATRLLDNTLFAQEGRSQ